MKFPGRIRLLPCLIFPFSAMAAPDGASDMQRSFSFDNGSGLYGSSTHYVFNSRHGDFYPHNGTRVSRYLLHRAYDTGTLHYGGTVSEDEYHHYGGLSSGSVTLAYFQGKGDSFSKASNPLYSDLNQYFFHGGSRSKFEIQGAGASVDLGNGLNTEFAFSTVTAPNVENRRGYYGGVSSRYFEAGVFRLERGDDDVGRGLNLGFQGGNLDLDYQQIQSVYGARVQRLELAWNSRSSGRFSVELEQAGNDLFSRDNEQRIMFRFRKRLGGRPVFNASEEADDEEQERPGFGRTVGIGVGLGAVAVALSSGDGDNDGARRFSERNSAAFAVLNRINPVSVRQNIEHGGWIFRNADNTFGHTQPVAGTVNSVNIGNPETTVPMGTDASASYHTHGGPDPRFDNENFSPQDILSDRLARVDGYLGTPAGFMKLHDFETATISVVGRINN